MSCVPFRDLCNGHLDKCVTLRAIVEDENLLPHSGERETVLAYLGIEVH